jgi:hypothetical protein
LTKKPTQFDLNVKLASVVMDLASSHRNLAHAVSLMMLHLEVPERTRTMIEGALETTQKGNDVVFEEMRAFIDMLDESRKS